MREREDFDVAHENAVDEFLRKAAQEGAAPLTDAKFADWLNRHRYPILTEDQLAWRRGREVAFTEQCLETGLLTQADGHRPTISLMADIFGRRIGTRFP